LGERPQFVGAVLLDDPQRRPVVRAAIESNQSSAQLNSVSWGQAEAASPAPH
jgi:hypothetical protein